MARLRTGWRLPARRVLVGYRAASLRWIDTDVLIVGSGAAALRAAAETAGRRTLLLTKRGVADASTVYAQGGVAAEAFDEEALEAHVEDTLACGRGLGDADVARTLVREGAACVRELIEGGARFDRLRGRYDLALEAGHSRRRIFHRGDRTGAEIARALRQRLGRRVRLVEDTFVVDLLVRRRRCLGALAWHPRRGLHGIRAGAVILATGGAGQVYRETTNPAVATGDGIAMAARAGAEIMDMEFVQFHPTVLYLAGASRSLISEAVRGAGAVLRDARGAAFMKRYHRAGDLAPRDVVSRRIITHMIRHGDTEVFLDARKVRGLKRKFPGLVALSAAYGLNPAKDLIPVRPAAHYLIGGVRTDVTGRTSLRNLFAIGECAATGFHGANRLASNSLLECLAMGRRAGRAAGETAGRPPSTRGLSQPARPRSHATADVEDLRRSLQSLMWRNVGIERSGDLLNDAIRRIRQWSNYTHRQEFRDPAGWELQNLMTVAGLIAAPARLRTESRGVHVRTDHPKRNDRSWDRHLIASRSGIRLA